MFPSVFGKCVTGEECKGKFWFCNSTHTLKKQKKKFEVVYLRTPARIKTTDRTVSLPEQTLAEMLPHLRLLDQHVLKFYRTLQKWLFSLRWTRRDLTVLNLGNGVAYNTTATLCADSFVLTPHPNISWADLHSTCLSWSGLACLWIRWIKFLTRNSAPASEVRLMTGLRHAANVKNNLISSCLAVHTQF